MNKIGQLERETQNRVVKLFQAQLGYEYLGSWEDRPNNRNIEVEELKKYLTSKGYRFEQISRAIDELSRIANNPNESLYMNNKQTYNILRYGVKIKAYIGENHETIELIDWKNPMANHFAIAEEVTILGNREKRPDIVLYVNGIAIGVLELKRSSESIGKGIRQSITNQQKGFIESFFSTIQFVFAGNDSEGLRYGTIGTEEKYFLRWKENIEDSSMYELDKYLIKMCSKQRLIELMFDYILFDGGIKKLPRVHQYFGIKAAQEHIRRREGGILWHTQGSGKSIVMVLLAKWILENIPNARVAIITDRDELDKQIKRVFEDAGEVIYKATSGEDLLTQLSQAKPRLLCSLVQKFGKKDSSSVDKFMEGVRNVPHKTVGDIYVFVDECHRTQSGKLHKSMNAILQNALFIGFTGTPLLKQDKETSLKVFGKYIHTYKFNEAVEDGVVLDLMYEARDIQQRVVSPERINAWFESKTETLNDFQKLAIKKKWVTMQHVLSSTDRMQQIVNDLVFDFDIKPRLKKQTGNAILVANSILDACKYYDLLQKTAFKGKCAIITSYNPSHRDIVTEDIGANTETDKELIYNLYSNILKDIPATPGKTKAETYEDGAKSLFLKQPASMKILVVVAKLLTGFDAPTCTYIYLDKEMQDHGLFQAICRVNRLDGEDKMFGYIIDYKKLLPAVKDTVSVYTSELDYDGFEKSDCDILLKDRLVKAKERLDNALEEIMLTCSEVPLPQSDLDYIRYFCGNPENPYDLKATEMKRTVLYKCIVSLIRAYTNILSEMLDAGYTQKEIDKIKIHVDSYLRLRDIIRKASGEFLDMTLYEADMRFLIDNYIQADPSQRVDPFENQSLLDVINLIGIDEAIKQLPEGIKQSKEAVAETISNNVRQKITQEYLIDPEYFDEMSKLLNALLSELKTKRIEYVEYLVKIADLAKKVSSTEREGMPSTIKTPGQRALYSNLGEEENLALACDEAIKYSRLLDWRGNASKENHIKSALYRILQSEKEVERIFTIIEAQSEY